jgi:CRISPR-associated endonuclease Cas1
LSLRTAAASYLPSDCPGKDSESTRLFGKKRVEPNHKHLIEAAQKLDPLEYSSTLATSRKELRGIEGQAASIYYRALATQLPSGFEFQSRQYPRAADPVNTLFNLGYTLLACRAHAALLANGFEPFIGVYHEARRGIPSLCYDLIEPLRPWAVDRWCLSLLSLRQVQLPDFDTRENGEVVLNPKALRAVVQKFGSMMEASLPTRNQFSHRSPVEVLRRGSNQFRKEIDTISS